MSSPSPAGLDAGRSNEDLLYRVDGMTCAHCKASVTSEVTKVAGVASVDVDLETKLVRVRGTAIDGAAVVAAVDEAGYDALPA
jgi:copper chaperone